LWKDTPDNDMHQPASAGPRPRTLEYARRNLEWCRPGGWWFRDLVLEALDAAYPRWLTSGELMAICAAIDAKAGRTGTGKRRKTLPVDYAGRTLSRLHSYRLVDRIGVPNWLAPRAYTCRGKPSKLPADTAKNAGYRYRAVREARELL